MIRSFAFHTYLYRPIRSFSIRIYTQSHFGWGCQDRQPRMSMTTKAAQTLSSSTNSDGLSPKDQQLVRLFLSICCHKWEDLVGLGQRSLDCGASTKELLGCVRHICVVAGYPPALAAVKKLHAGGLIQEKEPGKAGGPLGNAFDLVYATKASKIYENLYGMEPVVSEWIRCHCYGDIYSSPGLTLRQKQLMISGFLAEANMHDEYFGHVIAGIRFGSSLQQFLDTVDIAFEIAGTRQNKQEVYVHAIRLAEKAASKVAKDFPQGTPAEPEIDNDPDSLRLPIPPSPLEKAYFE